ncbi:sialidase-like protein [Colletotrichum plurivorum]|uniref:Sialidase-like protein n=1 Tax=Colletotrichum plurivorum TaxID=2175906 RepID=A0A8H6NKW2_9PEZI|nr:sialidase-like protein [Colletotrichum plurivorum]
MSTYEPLHPPPPVTYTSANTLARSLAADTMSFDFVFPSCEPSTPPSFSFDASLLDLSYHQPASTHQQQHYQPLRHHQQSFGHARSRSNTSVYSFVSAAESTPESVSTRMTTPSRASPPIRQHGPLLLPKIRSQDQAIESPPKRLKASPKPRAPAPRRSVAAAAAAASTSASAFRPTHARSFTNPETLTWNMPSSFVSQPEEPAASSLLCSPVIFADDMHSRRASSTCSLDAPVLEKYGFPTYRQMPAYVPASPAPAPAQVPRHDAAAPYMFPSYATPRAPSPLNLSVCSTPDPDPTPLPMPSTTLMTYLTGPNPAPSLVHTISFPLRDPSTKHFWWDVRQVRPWSSFNISAVLSLPGAEALLNCPVPAPLLPSLAQTPRHPETETALHAIYASHYLPKLNAALAVSSSRPMQLSVPSSSSSRQSAATDPLLFTASPAGEPASAAAIFGGKPTARVVGLVRSFDRFNTGMRVEGNIKRVEYLRGLAALHHAMREHGCRYGFILTEIELVVVRNGTEAVPDFGFLEVSSVQLAAVATEESEEIPLTACLALWGLCMMAGDDAPCRDVAHWRAEIGAPAEGTRRKAKARDEWMPKPQLAEKREAKRARGWVMPEDPVGRKELGKRGVRYGAC